MIAIALAMGMLQDPEFPKWNPPLESLKYLLRHQGADGSWGGRPATCTCRREPDVSNDGDLETTAWAILAFAGAGFTELSKDELDGRKCGLSLKSGMAWLLSKQDKDGAFDRSNVPVNAMAALALLEIDGMTLIHREPAQRAFEWIRRSKSVTDLGATRLGMVWESAMLDELTKDASDSQRGLAATLEAGKSNSAKVGALLIRAFAEFPRGTPRAKVDYTAIDPLKLSPEECHALTVAWCQMDGGLDWHDWYDRLRKSLVALQSKEGNGCESGSWGGSTLRERTRTAAIRCLTMEHYRCFLCRNPFGK